MDDTERQEIIGRLAAYIADGGPEAIGEVVVSIMEDEGVEITYEKAEALWLSVLEGLYLDVRGEIRAHAPYVP